MLVTVYLLLLLTASSQAQGDKSQRGSFVRIEPNYHSPHLYSETLTSRFTLINLPGSHQPGSYWTVEYEIYFVSEIAYQRTMKRLTGSAGTANPQVSDFDEKILLARGRFKGTRMSSLEARSREVGPIRFKSKVPDVQRTKAASLLTSYSVKIYDARLKKTIFDAGLWITKPFETGTGSQNAIPRRTLYANFFVSPEGDLFKSQWARSKSDATW